MTAEHAPHNARHELDETARRIPAIVLKPC
jgi:hypothetical protein